MSREDFTRCVNKLSENFRRSFGPVSLRGMWTEVKDLDVCCLEEATDWLVFNKTWMPSAQDVISACQKVQHERFMARAREREREAVHDKNELAQGTAKAFSGSDKAAQKGIKMMNAFLTGKLTHREGIENLLQYEKEFPGSGAEKIAREKENDLERAGISMDETIEETRLNNFRQYKASTEKRHIDPDFG